MVAGEGYIIKGDFFSFKWEKQEHVYVLMGIIREREI